jgi:hypothetical protein
MRATLEDAAALAKAPALLVGISGANTSTLRDDDAREREPGHRVITNRYLESRLDMRIRAHANDDRVAA